MLSRFIWRSSRFQPLFNFVSSQTYSRFSNPIPGNPFISSVINRSNPRPLGFFPYSTKDGDGKSVNTDPNTDLWKFSTETEESVESIFGDDTGNLNDEGNRDEDDVDNAFSMSIPDTENDNTNSDGVGENFGGGNEEWATASEDYKPWRLGGEGTENEEDIFGFKLEGGEIGVKEDDFSEEIETNEEQEKLETEEKALSAVLKGPDRAFGDLIASSGITDEMLDSLIALKDFEGIQGLPPLHEIEEKRYEKNAKKSSRAEIERLKQEEVANARVRQVDDKGRAYGTGKRKCSIARVWIQPGEGKFIVNDKEFDHYFPMIDHRATLLRPFSETKTMGMWDVKCTVQGGGTSGQVGAIRLGISRALQNWEPAFRPPLKSAGFITRDSRVVERKKFGRAKARKGFQWVKR